MALVPFDKAAYRRTVLSAVCQARRMHRGVIAEDLNGTLTYSQLFTRAFVLGRKLKPALKDEQYIGVLLPNSLGAVVTFIMLHLQKRIPCMLNFTAGPGNVAHACRIAKVKTVLTSRLFISKGKFEPIAEKLEKEVRVIYLEDLRKSIGLVDKIAGLLRAHLPIPSSGSPDDPAVVLYTSGSEGVPKGVALSHANMLSNIAQARARLDLPSSHILFNAMPVFHSFGLTIGMIMPLVCGIRTFFYPSPVQYREIAETIGKIGATIMLGTDTFYKGYAHYGKPEQFRTIKLAVAGAEKLNESTRINWQEKFGVTILQGYGVTETSPVISVNTPEAHKPGSVGVAVPGMECRTEAVDGIAQGGKLLVKGPNVMLGYLKVDQPGVIQPQGEWYDTGDIVTIDAQGFISIVGRAKRFAKISGEMISLLSVEELACAAEPEAAHAAIAIPEERKGEQVVLYTESKTLEKDALLKEARRRGVSEICLPRQIIFMEAIPRLGTGKIDYPALQAIAKKAAGN